MKHSSVATAVGVSMGVLGFIILIILGFVCYWRRKKQKLKVRNTFKYGGLNPFTRQQILDSSKLKKFADDNFKFDKNV